MAIDLSKHLNPSQYKAVVTTDKPVLVIAGAGSGKTRVIEYKVIHLLEKKINPQSILLLTFTRKAASEMLSRAGRHDVRCEQIEGGTFHSFAYKVLKRFAQKVGLPNSFSILDDSDANELIARCTVKLGLLDVEKRFPKNETLKSIISKSINKQSSIKAVLEREYPQFEEFSQEITRLREVYFRYKREVGYVDYDDLLVYLKMLLEVSDLRQRIASQFQYVMVDEYQDTNKLQGDIAYLLAESHGNIMAVGDDAQSIYGFRGATHQNIMEFPLQFPGCEVIKLEQNYRSTQSILDVSNVVLDNMSKKYEKRLVASKEDLGLRPQFVGFKNSYQEAEWVAKTIKELRDDGIPLGKQAVLFRSAYISISLQAELNRLGIPFRVYGGLKFYETAHVKDMVALLKILQSPRDELAWSRVLRFIEGVGPVTVDKITAAFAEETTLTGVLTILEKQFGRGFKFSKDIEKIVKVYENLIGIDSVEIQFIKLIEYYDSILRKKYDEWHLRRNDLDVLAEIASGYKSLEQFLVDLALEPPQQGVAEVGAELDDETPLTLSTIHSAKGLEWDVVFVIGMVDGVLPSRFSLRFKDQLEEEHRLFYVAVTRAKQYLYLTMHHEGSRYGLSQFNRVSRFLESRNILEKLDQQLIEHKTFQIERTKLAKDKRMRLVSDDFEEIDTTDKKSLFKKINDSWKW
ncbi:MAG: ATP-dependent helicase [Patescibacteria group bacterium]|jgi:DNA helicase-2/ATP-dependent DNA helicase PcrA